MFTIIATLEYRTFIPHGWIATEFCHLNVMGVNDRDVKELEEAWNDIKFEKYRNIKTEITTMESRKTNLQEQIDNLKNKYKLSKKWYRFANKQEKAWLAEAEAKNNEIISLDDNINQLKENQFYSSTELYHKACDLLASQGFVLTSKSSSGNGCVTYTEIWHKTVN